MDLFEADDNAWVGILASNHPKVFCAGADLKSINQGTPKNSNKSNVLKSSLLSLCVCTRTREARSASDHRQGRLRRLCQLPAHKAHDRLRWGHGRNSIILTHVHVILSALLILMPSCFYNSYVTLVRRWPVAASSPWPATSSWHREKYVNACVALLLVISWCQAVFGVPEVKRSLVAAAGGYAQIVVYLFVYFRVDELSSGNVCRRLYRLPKKLPQAIAMEMVDYY
jgi:hypothetical protein